MLDFSGSNLALVLTNEGDFSITILSYFPSICETWIDSDAKNLASLQNRGKLATNDGLTLYGFFSQASFLINDRSVLIVQLPRPET